MTGVKMKEVPSQERPRERMMREGVESLSNMELLAILLRTGTRSQPVTDLAQKILSRLKGLRDLKNMSIEDLTSIKGVGPAKAVQVLAGIELGRRLSKEVLTPSTAFTSPKEVANLVMEDMRYLTKEHFVCLFLNTKNRLLAQKTVFMGSLNASIVHPREIFKEAIQRSSASVICLHNHPSGDPTPSREDIEVTRRLIQAGEIVGIEVLDHVIIGDGNYVSLKEKGYI